MPNLTTEQTTFTQQVASTSTSILLEAVAGSGKTTTLVAAAEYLQPGLNTLAVAFNSKNREDLARRMPKDKVACLTFNGLGHRAWYEYLCKRLNVSPRKVGNIVADHLEAHSMKDQVLWFALRDMVVGAKTVGLVPTTLVPKWPSGPVEDTEENWNYIAQRFAIDTGDYDFNQLIPHARVILAENNAQAFHGKIDFDDQIYLPVCWKAPFPKYSTVLVDEAQDLSELQHTMVERSVKPQGRVIAVGDPNQAIYGFRGASSNSMNQLAEKFKMEKLGLTYNFRCGAKIINIAQRLVPEIQSPPDWYPGKVIKLDSEDGWSFKELPSECTILCRNIAPLCAVGLKLIMHGIPAYMVGRDIGKSFIKIASSFKAETQPILLREISTWRAGQVNAAKTRNDEDMVERVRDQAEALRALTLIGECQSADQLQTHLQKLFSAENGRITLSTIHRAKGQEWDSVVFLDRWRCPSKRAKHSAELDPEGCGWMLQQEKNLEYIAITRAKHELIFANLTNCIEMKKLTETEGE